jgi:hypothetical protein
MFKPYYNWMKQQLKVRTFAYKGGTPVWAWLERPDLRRSSLLPKGTTGVLLTFEIEANKALISNFYAWNTVLCDSYVGLNDEAFDTFWANPTEEAKIRSWERVFDLEAVKGYHGNVLQCCVERIPISNVLKEQEFTAK